MVYIRLLITRFTVGHAPLCTGFNRGLWPVSSLRALKLGQPECCSFLLFCTVLSRFDRFLLVTWALCHVSERGEQSETGRISGINGINLSELFPHRGYTLGVWYLRTFLTFPS